MKKALVNVAFGHILEVRADTFPVAAGLEWKDVPDDTTTYDSWLNGALVKAPSSSPTTDLSNSDNLNKVQKAILIACAAMSGKTAAQAKTAFKAAWDALS